MPDYPINPDTATMKFNFKVIVSICIATIAYTQLVYSQANCNNVDFEDGNFTNWIGSTGTCCPISTPTNGIVPAQHSVVSGAGFDVVVPTLPIVSPFGGTYSVKLGNENTGAQAEKLRYDFLVTAQNPNFTYQYAVVFQDPGHSASEQPRFQVNVKTQGGQQVTCGYYNVVASGSIPGFQTYNSPTYGTIRYKDWSLVAVDLSNYIGQTIVIDFQTGDCDLGGHFGYAYIDASCNPLQITSNYCPGDPVGTLTAPVGFQSYQWSTGQTTQTITINSPNPGDTVTVTCVPFAGGPACASKLQYVFLQSPPVDANFSVDVSCGNSAVVLTDSSTIVAANAQITGWEWIVNNTVVSTSSTFTYGFPGPGTYPITIIAQSNAGCPDTLTRTVNIPQGLDVITATPSTSNYNGFGVSCPGASDGIVSVTASYGTPPYTFAWSTSPSSTATTVSNLPAGTYVVTVTETGGCQVIDTAVLTSPDSIKISPSATDVQCYGESNGSIDLNPSGGVLTLTTSWQHNSSLTAASASGLAANTYAFTITDANGCTFDSSIAISQPAAPYNVSGQVTNATCYNGCNGSIDVNNVSGNTAPYTYYWSTIPPQTTAIASNLCAGQYTITITDANNCTTSAPFTVTEPSELLPNATKTDLLCNGDNSGTVSANATGGTAPYNYTWNDANNSTTANVTGLAIGTYNVTIYDSYQCSATATTTLTQPAVLQVAATHQDVACFGGNTGRAFSTVQGGTAPYSYAWNTSPVQTTATATGLTANTYNLAVLDAHNCTAVATATVSEPTLLTAAITDTVHNICYGGTIGSATVAGTGGSLPYTYTWNTTPAQTTAAISQLAANTYIATVTDDSLCTAIATVVITQPTQITIAPTVAPALCYDSAQGSISLAVSQGTPAPGGGPAGYTYTWSPNVSTSETATNLLAGTYNVTVYDANQCFEARTYTINQPPQLSIATTHDDASCYSYSDGVIRVQAGGGTPSYSYSLWQAGSQLSANNSGTFSGLPLGSYVAQFTDSHGCTTNVPVSIQQPTELLVQSISADSVNCFGYRDGSITVSGTGSVPPYTYTIDHFFNNTSGYFFDLAQGTYHVAITDAHNCSVTTTAIVNEPYDQVVTTNPTDITLKLGETKPVVVLSNYDPATQYAWSTWQGLDCQDCPNVNITLYESYTYTITVTAHPHDLDCKTVVDVPVTVIPNYDVFVPNAFSPNADGANDYFEFFGNKPAIKQLEVKVFNRIGEKLFESNDVNFKWDGTFKGVKQNPAVYVYTLRLVFYDNHVDELRKGSITLLK
jgi:gliding motility-associated-like protein